MLSKIEITAVLEVLTGMHIGGTNEFAAIGAVDSPVVRDALSRLPMIPGSSFKGKMRTLLSRNYSSSLMPVEIKVDPDIVKRLFGDSNDKKYRRSRLQFTDSILSNLDEIKAKGARRATEVKFENSIKRLTSEANPRQIERVIPGCRFEISIIYNINSDEQRDEQILEDFKAVADGFRLIEYDYLGGSGTRGYGKVKFGNIDLKPVFGDIDEELIDKCRAVLGE
ncbi:MAG: type III-A CRISPR-associated RAMP protein Csm3 [Clostridiales bacterium]|nr:type III-A CRISPR-associated RAMP protein Csm3 [Clostridiales bacterium]